MPWIPQQEEPGEDLRDQKTPTTIHPHKYREEGSYKEDEEEDTRVET